MPRRPSCLQRLKADDPAVRVAAAANGLAELKPLEAALQALADAPTPSDMRDGTVHRLRRGGARCARVKYGASGRGARPEDAALADQADWALSRARGDAASKPLDPAADADAVIRPATDPPGA